MKINIKTIISDHSSKSKISIIQVYLKKEAQSFVSLIFMKDL